MKVVFRGWRWSLPLCVALVAGSLSVRAQQPLPWVELAQPIPAPPAPLELDSAELPTLAVPAPATQGPVEAHISDDLPSQQNQPGEDQPETAQPGDEDAAPAEPNIEVVKERYLNGVVRVEREVTLDAGGNYIPHGLWRQFDPTGRLIAEGRFVESQQEGIWRRLYSGSDAPLFATAPYHSFTPPFVSQATFVRGNLHGKWLVTDAKQRKVHELEFEEDERHGPSTWYYPSGQVMLSAQYDRDRAHGEMVQYDSDSQVAAKEIYENGRKLAPKTEYHDARQLTKRSESMYLFATLVAKTPDDWNTATLAEFESRGQDEKHGPFTAWHNNGQLARQGEFRYDLPVGQFTYWYPNGQKQMEGTYIDGRQQGQWTWWHENGLKSIGGEYHDGGPVGPWSWWLASGKLSQRADLSEKPLAGPTPEAEPETREAKIRLAEPVVELR
ncbi:MAG: hypothetical protein WD872_21525 [Pirellulaceae bacterium]